jgi:hypothetical protein
MKPHDFDNFGEDEEILDDLEIKMAEPDLGKD